MAKKTKKRKIAAIFADGHLARRTWKHKPIEGDSYWGFRQICQRAIEEEVEFVIGAGDLIDKRLNEPEPIVFMQKMLEYLNEAGIDFLFVQGQHEMDAHEAWFNMSANATHLHEKSIAVGDLWLYGLDYTPKDKIDEAFAGIPDDADILVAHQVWGDFMGDIALPQCDFLDVPKVAGVITGDYHDECVLDTYEGADGQDILVFNPGATCQQKITEPCKHYFGWLMEDGTIEIEQLLSRHFIEETILTEKDMEQFIENLPLYLEGAGDYYNDKELPAELMLPFVRVIYSHRLERVTQRIKKIADENGGAHLFWKELPKEKEDKTSLEKVPDLEKGEAIDLQSCLSQQVDPEENPSVFALAQRLLQAGESKEDKQAELERWKKEMMA